MGGVGLLESASIDAGVLGGEEIGSGEDLLGAVEMDVGAGEFFGFLGLVLRLVELSLKFEDRGGPHASYGPLLLWHDRRFR